MSDLAWVGAEAIRTGCFSERPSLDASPFRMGFNVPEPLGDRPPGPPDEAGSDSCALIAEAVRTCCSSERPSLAASPFRSAVNAPEPAADRPPGPCPETLAACPGRTSAYWPDLKSATSTCPLTTSTLASFLFTETRNCVPFTTAARYGVSTSKCLTLRLSTSRRIEPAC